MTSGVRVLVAVATAAGVTVLVAVSVKVAVGTGVLVAVGGGLVGLGVGVNVRVGVPVNEGVRVSTWVDVGDASAGDFVGVGAAETPPSLSLPQPASPTSRQIANKPALGAVNFAFLRFIGGHRYQPAWRMKSHEWSKCVLDRSGRPKRTPLGSTCRSPPKARRGKHGAIALATSEPYGCDDGKRGDDSARFGGCVLRWLLRALRAQRTLAPGS